jgi:hypothetical protein
MSCAGSVVPRSDVESRGKAQRKSSNQRVDLYARGGSASLPGAGIQTRSRQTCRLVSQQEIQNPVSQDLQVFALEFRVEPRSAPSLQYQPCGACQPGSWNFQLIIEALHLTRPFGYDDFQRSLLSGWPENSTESLTHD